MVTAKTEPMRSLQKVMAREIAANVSSALRITNTDARDSSQFSAAHTIQIAAARGKKRTNAKLGRGFASGEAKLATIAAPEKARIAANAITTRKKFRASSERNRENRFSGSEESAVATSLRK